MLLPLARLIRYILDRICVRIRLQSVVFERRFATFSSVCPPSFPFFRHFSSFFAHLAGFIRDLYESSLESNLLPFVTGYFLHSLQGVFRFERRNAIASRRKVYGSLSLNLSPYYVDLSTFFVDSPCNST